MRCPAPTASRSIPGTFTGSSVARVTRRRERISFPISVRAASWSTTTILTKSGDTESDRRGPPRRLKNGNTFITDEADNLTREVNHKGETVWEFKSSQLPEAYRLVQAPQTCTRLANGNTIFTSRGGGAKGPQLVEIIPDKKVVWVLQDWQDLGDATAVQILDDPGIPEIPGECQH